MQACDFQSLVALANPIQQIPQSTALQVQVALLAQIAGAPYNSMSFQQLVALANPLQQMSDTTARQVTVALLCQIVQEV